MKEGHFPRKRVLPPKLLNKCPCFDEILCKFCFYWSWTLRQRENRAVLTAWELVVNGTSSSRRRQQQRYSFARNAAAAVYWCQFLRLIVNAKKKVCPTTVTIRQKKLFFLPLASSWCAYVVIVIVIVHITSIPAQHSGFIGRNSDLRAWIYCHQYQYAMKKYFSTLRLH